MIQNKLNFFFKHQIWHIGGLIVLFYIGLQIVDFENSSNVFLGISSKNRRSHHGPRRMLSARVAPRTDRGQRALC